METVPGKKILQNVYIAAILLEKSVINFAYTIINLIMDLFLFLKKSEKQFLQIVQEFYKNVCHKNSC